MVFLILFLNLLNCQCHQCAAYHDIKNTKEKDKNSMGEEILYGTPEIIHCSTAWHLTKWSFYTVGVKTISVILQKEKCASFKQDFCGNVYLRENI